MLHSLVSFIYLFILLYWTGRQCLICPRDDPKTLHTLVHNILHCSYKKSLVIACSLDLNWGRVLLSIKSFGRSHSYNRNLILGPHQIFNFMNFKGTSKAIQYMDAILAAINLFSYSPSHELFLVSSYGVLNFINWDECRRPFFANSVSFSINDTPVAHWDHTLAHTT